MMCTVWRLKLCNIGHVDSGQRSRGQTVVTWSRERCICAITVQRAQWWGSPGPQWRSPWSPAPAAGCCSPHSPDTSRTPSGPAWRSARPAGPPTESPLQLKASLPPRSQECCPRLDICTCRGGRHGRWLLSRTAAGTQPRSAWLSSHVQRSSDRIICCRCYRDKVVYSHGIKIFLILPSIYFVHVITSQC